MVDKRLTTWVYVAVMWDGEVLKEPRKFTTEQRQMANLIIEHDTQAMTLTVTKNRYAGCHKVQNVSGFLVAEHGPVSQHIADRMVEAHVEMITKNSF